jgi:ferredoxin
MPRVITNLCLRDASCVTVCPVDCISPGKPVDKYPTYYIDPDACIDCGACEIECPHSAIFELDSVPSRYVAKGEEILSMSAETKGFSETYYGHNKSGEPVVLGATKKLIKDETVDLTPAIATNREYYATGLGYSAQD